jgi:enoyl-CoA hydratase/carnithine racemase
VSYRAIEALRVPTIATVRGFAFGGGFELALACDFLVASETATFRCVEVTSGMLPLAGGLQRLAGIVGTRLASRFSMLGEPISGAEAGRLAIASHVVSDDRVEDTARTLAERLSNGPTLSYAATRTLLKAFANGGITGADAMMLDVTMDLFNSDDTTRGFRNTAEAFDAGVAPPALIFRGR